MKKVLVLLLLLISAGCGSSKYVTTSLSPKWDDARISKIAIIPFAYIPESGISELPARKSDPGESICYEVYTHVLDLRSAKVSPEGVERISGLFLRGLEKAGYKVITFDEETRKKMCAKGMLPSDIIKLIEEKEEVEAILTGVVTRYEEREGGSYGIRKPASIGFEANLISTSEGALLWSGHYAETQKSLVEDLGLFFTFIKRRGRWLTAEELARYGVNKVLKTIPGPPLQ